MDGQEPVEALAIQLDAAFGNLAALGLQQPRDRLQGRRLAGAVGAEEGGDVPLLGVQRDALQHQDDAVIDDFDVVERQHWTMARLFGLLDCRGNDLRETAEPLGLLDELAALDLEDLDKSATLVVGRGHLERWNQTTEAEILDRLEALLDVLAGRLLAAVRFESVANRLDMDSGPQHAAIVHDRVVHRLLRLLC